MVNCKIVRSIDRACWQCAVLEAEHTDMLVQSELGWCSCGTCANIDALMVRFLETRCDGPSGSLGIDGMATDTALLLAYIADEAGWTEHGTFIEWSWLTAAGKEALANLKAAAATTIEPIDLDTLL